MPNRENSSLKRSAANPVSQSIIERGIDPTCTHTHTHTHIRTQGQRGREGGRNAQCRARALHSHDRRARLCTTTPCANLGQIDPSIGTKFVDILLHAVDWVPDSVSLVRSAHSSSHAPAAAPSSAGPPAQPPQPHAPPQPLAAATRLPTSPAGASRSLRSPRCQYGSSSSDRRVSPPSRSRGNGWTRITGAVGAASPAQVRSWVSPARRNAPAECRARHEHARQSFSVQVKFTAPTHPGQPGHIV